MPDSAQIELEIWEGLQHKRERLPSATLQALGEALARLDGNRIDSVWIEFPGTGALCVGGGPKGFVVVSFPEDGSSSHVEAGSIDDQTVELQVGGQMGVYERTMVLPAELAFAIAERFLASGQFDSALNWVEDCPPERLN